MGGCASSGGGVDADVNEAPARRARRRSEMKLLLLGTGGSGKTTLAKQLRIVHALDYTHGERVAWCEHILSNVLDVALRIYSALTRHASSSLLAPSLARAMHRLDADYAGGGGDDDIVVARAPHVRVTLAAFFAAPWRRDAAFVAAYVRAGVYAMPDAVTYWLHNAERLVAPHGFVPTNDDIVHARVRSRRGGVVETCFTARRARHTEFTFRLVDVGGQRAERHTWIRHFENVTAIIFVASLVGYAHARDDDDGSCASHLSDLSESLALFDTLINDAFFASTAVILFLNKRDLFDDETFFHANNVARYYTYADAAVRTSRARARGFVRQMFLDKERRVSSSSPRRHIYTHFTTATDVENVRRVSDDITDVLLNSYVGATFG